MAQRPGEPASQFCPAGAAPAFDGGSVGFAGRTDLDIRGIGFESRVAIVSDFPEEPAAVSLDKNLVAQVFDNIIQNALQAIAERGGTLSVTVVSHYREPGSNRDVSVEFRDTGKGDEFVDRRARFRSFFYHQELGNRPRAFDLPRNSARA
jgi:hypothetical protein